MTSLAEIKDSVIDFNAVPYKQFRRFLRRNQNPENMSEDDIDETVELLSRVVKRWPFDSDPSLASSWEDLGSLDFHLILRHCFNEFSTQLEGKGN